MDSKPIVPGSPTAVPQYPPTGTAADSEKAESTSPPSPSEAPSEHYPPPIPEGLPLGFQPFYPPRQDHSEYLPKPVISPQLPEVDLRKFSYTPVIWPSEGKVYHVPAPNAPVFVETERAERRDRLLLAWYMIIQQIYLHFLLRLPALYFDRVARIFEEADLSLPEIKKMALETTSEGMIEMYTYESMLPPQYRKLKDTWEAFIDSVMREWKTLNIISVLLLS